MATEDRSTAPSKWRGPAITGGFLLALAAGLVGLIVYFDFGLGTKELLVIGGAFAAFVAVIVTLEAG